MKGTLKAGALLETSAGGLGCMMAVQQMYCVIPSFLIPCNLFCKTFCCNTYSRERSLISSNLKSLRKEEEPKSMPWRQWMNLGSGKKGEWMNFSPVIRVLSSRWTCWLWPCAQSRHLSQSYFCRVFSICGNSFVITMSFNSIIVNLELQLRKVQRCACGRGWRKCGRTKAHT